MLDNNMDAILNGAVELTQKKTVVQPPKEEIKPEIGRGLIIEKPKQEVTPESELGGVQMNSGLSQQSLGHIANYLDETESEAEKVKKELEERGINLDGYDLDDPYASQAHMTKLMNGGGPEVEEAGEAVVVNGEVIGTAGTKLNSNETVDVSDEYDDEEEHDDYDPEESENKYREAVVIIDKGGIGQLKFTDEEREKLQISEVIKVKEVETIEVKTRKTKKIFNKKVGKILAKKSNGYTTNIVLPGSGYTAEIKACSTYELLGMLLSDKVEKDKVLAEQKKWSIIHSKLVSTSIGKMDFNEFLKHTHPGDLETFIYGILCATYGAQEKSLPLNCEKHKPIYEFTHKMYMKDLLRAERMSDRTMELVTGIVDNSYSLETAVAYHNSCPIMLNKTIILPESGFEITLQVQNVYDKVNKSIELKEQLEQDDLMKARLVDVAGAINSIIIEDEDDPNEPYEVTGLEDIVEVLYMLGDIDSAVVTKQADVLNERVALQFGAMNTRCDRCGKVTPFVPLGIESLLFYMVSQSQSKNVELESGTN